MITWLQDTLYLNGMPTGEIKNISHRQQNTGWLDLVVGKYAVDINGLTDVVITKIDVLCGLDTLKICNYYEIYGKVYPTVPDATENLTYAQPIYE